HGVGGVHDDGTGRLLAVRPDEPLPRRVQRPASAAGRRLFASTEPSPLAMAQGERTRRATTLTVASTADDALGDARALVRACADGDGAARRRFQERFAED